MTLKITIFNQQFFSLKSRLSNPSQTPTPALATKMRGTNMVLNKILRYLFIVTTRFT